MTPKERALIKYLFELITPQRSERINTILANRTDYLTVVIEDIYQEHNHGAIMRSCECFGVQQVHVIDGHYEKRIAQRMARGAEKWVDVHRYGEESYPTEACINGLKEKGYKIAVTSPNPRAVTCSELQLDQPIALVMGAEKKGVSKKAKELADIEVTIPMVGFTESLNVSVATALLVNGLSDRIRKEVDHWELSDERLQQLRLDWALKSIPRPNSIISMFEQAYNDKNLR